jgi:heptaprenylglyceryl phosphate synthase
MDEFQKIQLLDEVAELSEKVHMAEVDLATARSIRDQAIIKALDAGVRQVDVVGATGLTRDAIYKLVSKRKEM